MEAIAIVIAGALWSIARELFYIREYIGSVTQINVTRHAEARKEQHE